MPYKLAEKLRNLEPYQPINGEYKIRLDANESFINLAEAFSNRVSAVISNLDFNRYPDPYAAKLCKVFAERYSLQPEWVTAFNGSDESISVIFSSFLQKGETVLTLTPDFSMYQFYGALSECKLVTLQKQEGFVTGAEEIIKAACESGAKMIIFSNPCNPTSLGIKKEQILSILSHTEALVVLDEAYMDFWDQSALQEVERYDNLIVLKTCSKAVGAAALRLGFAVACPGLTRALRAAKSPYNVNAVTQAIGEVLLSEKALLSRCVKQIKQSMCELQQGLELLAKESDQIVRVYPSCTNFVFLEMKNAKGVYEALLESSIAVRRLGKNLRITAGSPEENRELLAALRHIFKKGGNK